MTNDKRIFTPAQAINAAIAYPPEWDIDIKSLEESALTDFLDCFLDNFNNATLELIALKTGNCSSSDTPAIEEALRIWTRERLEKMLEELGHDAHRSHRFKDILSEEIHKHRIKDLDDTEF